MKGPKAPYVPTPQDQASAQMQIDNNNATIAAQQKAAQDAADQQANQQKLDVYNTGLNNALTTARASATQGITDKGLDPNDFSSTIDSLLNNLKAQVPYEDQNPGSYFANQDIAGQVINNETTKRRQTYGNQVNQFAGNGFANTMLNDNSDDDIINSILSEQYAPVEEQLNRAQQRGTLNAQGYSVAQNTLNNQRSAALSKLGTIGSGILATDRSDLSSIGDQARTAASNYNIGDSFDPTTYKSQIDSLYGNDTSNLDGAIRNAVGGQQFFDIGSILGQGATSQGTTNSNTRSLADAFASQQADKSKQRGLGQQGVF